MRESFVFYRSFYDALLTLPDDQRGRIFSAISGYALDGVSPELSGVERVIFMLIKPQIDANNKKFENGKSGGKYGSMGGRPRKNNPEITPEKPLDNPKQTPNVNVNENVNVNANENDNVNENVFIGAKAPSKKTGSRLSDDWELSQELGDWAETKGFTGEQILREAEKFKNYWISKTGKSAVKLDWDATWRTWILNAMEYRR